MEIKSPYDYLQKWAIERPGSVAIAEPAAQIDFFSLNQTVKKVASKLRKLGVEPGDIVLTGLPPTLEIIFSLAIFHEAAISCTISAHSLGVEPEDAKFCISYEPVPGIPIEKMILIGKEWMLNVQSITEINPPRYYPAPNSIVRLALTSGTTGKPKSAVFELDRYVKRLENQIKRKQGRGVSLSLLSYSGGWGFNHAMGEIARGMPVLNKRFWSDQEGAIALARKYKIESITGSVAQLSGFVSRLKGDMTGLTNLKELNVGGSMVFGPRAKEIGKALGVPILVSYASTEAGAGARKNFREMPDPFCMGEISEQATLEIVDGNDVPVPVGVSGIIRIKSEIMAKEYFKNPIESAKSFRNGWFYPGDTGYIAPGKILFLAGRVSELINAGGVKVAPSIVEEWALAQPGILDAAAFGSFGPQGTEAINLAVVASAQFDVRNFSQEARKDLNVKAPSRVFQVNEIPRNDTGKILRDKLRKITELRK